MTNHEFWERYPMPTLRAEDRLDGQAPTRPLTLHELYDRYADRVYRYALARLGSVPDAEDVTAQTFLAALEGYQRYAQRGSVAAWLFGIARHKIQDSYRQDRHWLPLENAHDMPSPAAELDDAVDDELWLSKAVQAIGYLSSERAEALTLRIFGGLSAAEIGKMMGKSEDAVRMLVRRAVQDLQTQLHLSEDL